MVRLRPVFAGVAIDDIHTDKVLSRLQLDVDLARSWMKIEQVQGKGTLD